jgi:splicing factor 3A subunit 2
LLIAAEPYENISFKVQSREIDQSPGKFWTYWDKDSKQFSLQFFFKNASFESDAAPGVAAH